MTTRLLPILFALATLTPQQRELNVQSFDKVWTTIKDRHWDPKLGGVNWQGVRDELRPQMEQADSPATARAVLTSMISRLNQSHFNIVPAELYKDLDQKGGADPNESSTGIDLRVIDGKALVISVEETSDANRRGIRPGWQLVKVDGAALSPLLANIAEVYKQSTLLEIMAARAVVAKLAGKVGDPVRLELLDGSNQPVEAEVVRGKPKGVRVRFGNMPVRYVWMETRRLDGNIGYIILNIFLSPTTVMKEFEDAVKSCMSCDGIVIDLRGNPGGIGGMSMGMAGWFIEKENRRLGTMYTREAPLKFFVNPRLETYRGPLAILVDGLSGSNSEVFAGGMKDLGRAHIFGARTAGAALPSVFERLPNGDGFQYAIANYISEGGQPLEGVGVIPHEEVKLTREAHLERRDLVIEAAVKWMRKTKETK